MRGQDGSRLCPFDSKNERKPSRSSAEVRMRLILRSALAEPLSVFPTGVRPRCPLWTRSSWEGGGRSPAFKRPTAQGLLRECAETVPAHPQRGQTFEEAQVKDAALPIVERAQARRQHRAVLADLVLVLELAERLQRIELG